MRGYVGKVAKIDIVVDYLLCQCEDITPLALQKALYGNREVLSGGNRTLSND